MAVGGFGFGLLFVPLSVAVLSSVPPAETTKVSAMLAIFQQLGASVSTAVMVTIVNRSSALHLDRLAAEISLRRAPIVDFLADKHHSLATLAALVNREAVALGFADAYVLSGFAGLVLVPIALFFPMRRARPAGATGDTP